MGQQLGGTSLAWGSTSRPAAGGCQGQGPWCPQSLLLQADDTMRSPGPELWPRGYSRPDGVGEEGSCTQEGGEAQQSDEHSAHA